MSVSQPSYPEAGTFSPATGEEIEPVEPTDPERVREAVERARAAQKQWLDTTFSTSA